MNKPIVSFVIPVFNGAATIGACVKSIVDAGLPPSEYEIICVDDASTDGITGETLQEIAAAYPSVNISILTHEVNKRQGGARNTGVGVAEGKYIMFIDCDDTFNSSELGIFVHAELQSRVCDLFYFCFSRKGIRYSDFPTLHGVTDSGEKMLQRGCAPWVPWQFAYRREFLIEQHCEFVEHHLFEDTDFALKTIILAKSVYVTKYCLYNHNLNECSTSYIGSDIRKIMDHFYLYERLHRLSATADCSEITRSVLEQHCAHLYKFIIKSLLWRFPFRLRKQVRKCPPLNCL